MIGIKQLRNNEIILFQFYKIQKKFKKFTRQQK